MKKAQSSLEFLIIIGIAFVFILLLGGVFFSFSNSSKSDLDSKQVTKIGNELVSNIEKMYFRGIGNKVQYNANMPDGITNMSIHYQIDGSRNFTYLNLTRIGNRGGEVSNIFFTQENYIQFTCVNCSNTSPIDYTTNFTQYFKPEDFSAGKKTISIRSLAQKVELEFIK